MLQTILKLWRQVRAPGRSQAVKSEIDEELQFHLEQRIAQNIAAGMPPEKAAQEARKRFGNLQRIREECREARGVAWMDSFTQDLRFGLRLWKKQPWSSLAAVLALTLGIGLVTFSLCAINCVFFGQLPFPHADRIVYATIPPPFFPELQKRQTSFEELSAFTTLSANFKAKAVPSRRRVCVISANFLKVVQAVPLSGRGFLPDDEKPEAAPVMLVGYDLWQQEFQGNPAALGSTILLDGKPRAIVGIMPKGFAFPIMEQLWIPNQSQAPTFGQGFSFGRLKPAVTIADAQLELYHLATEQAAGKQTQAGFPPMPEIRVGHFTQFLSDLKGSHGPGVELYAMLIVTLLVLFIAGANVAGLSLANATKRGTELAIRGALGATRARLVFQMLIESLILATAGAVGALLCIASLGKWLDGWFAANEGDSSEIPFWMHLQIDGRILFSLLGLVFLTNLLAGLWPALQATRRDVNEMLKAGTGGAAAIHKGKIQWVLIMVQIAFSVVVLAQSVVLLGFSRHLQQFGLPFDPNSVLTARINLPPSADARSFYQQLERDLPGRPGIQAVALSSSDPATGHTWKPLSIEGRKHVVGRDQPWAAPEVVSAGFFPALNLPILEGRNFNAADTTHSLPVAVVSSAFAKSFFPAGDALGHRFRAGTNEWLTIVGCVTDLVSDPLEKNHQPVFYTLVAQQPADSMILLLRGTGTMADLTKTAREEVARLEPDLALSREATVRALMNHQVIGYYLGGLLLAICSGACLFLATLGIIGLISLSITQRTREIGVRLALGAPRHRVVLTLLRQVCWQISAGLAAGALPAFAFNQFLIQKINGYPTVPHPNLMLLAAVGFLATVSFMAVLVPAIRGASIEPMRALRHE